MDATAPSRWIEQALRDELARLDNAIQNPPASALLARDLRQARADVDRLLTDLLVLMEQRRQAAGRRRAGARAAVDRCAAFAPGARACTARPRARRAQCARLDALLLTLCLTAR
jgi:hypothetical protein